MVSCSKLKTDVLGTLMFGIVGLFLLITAILTDFWVQGTAVTVGGEAGVKGTITVNFGLFSGTKTRERRRTCTRDIAVVCSSSAGVCMFSCGLDKAGEDLDDILGSNATDNSDGDNIFCGDCSTSLAKNRKYLASVLSGVEHTRAAADPGEPSAVEAAASSMLLTYGVWLSCLVCLFTGLACAVGNLIFTLINVAHSPVSSWAGIDGLIAWNLGAALFLLLTVCIWGAGFASKMSSCLPISDLLRPGPVTWSSADNSSLAFSYWLILVDVFLHLGIAGVMAFRQYRIYYAPRSRQAKVLEQRVKETATSGSDMLF